jgi:hypothetical protein
LLAVPTRPSFSSLRSLLSCSAQLRAGVRQGRRNHRSLTDISRVGGDVEAPLMLLPGN